MGKKDDRMGNKTGYKKERQRENREREKRIEQKKSRQAGQLAFSYKNNANFMRKQGMRPVHQASSGSPHSYK